MSTVRRDRRSYSEGPFRPRLVVSLSRAARSCSFFDSGDLTTWIHARRGCSICPFHHVLEALIPFSFAATLWPYVCRRREQNVSSAARMCWQPDGACLASAALMVSI
jgi:hypothetical protein